MEKLPPDADEDPRVNAFKNWSIRYAQRIRAQLSTETLGQKLQANDLMNDEAEFPC